MSGITCVSSSRQYGHCGSTYSVSVTRAELDPSTNPCCGMPRKSPLTSAAPGRALRSEPFVGSGPTELLLPPPSATASAMPTAASTMTPPATASTRGEARRGWAPFVRTGGGCARRICLLLRPLAICFHGTGLPLVGSAEREQRCQQHERRQRERRDRHPAEFVDPFHG